MPIQTFDANNNLLVSSKDTALEVIGTPAAAINALLIPSTDITGYSIISLQLTGTFVATVFPEQSNDNVTWYPLPFIDAGTITNPVVSGRTTIGMIYIPVSGFRYFRARLSSYTSGSVTGVAEISSDPTPLPFAYSAFQAAQPVFLSPSTTSPVWINHRNLDAQITGTLVKAAGGIINDILISNLSAAIRFLKLYDKATSAGLATDTPVKTIPVLAGTSIHLTPGISWRFGAGISYRATQLLADADATAPAANDVLVNLTYV
jgi:hypothetical protein